MLSMLFSFLGASFCSLFRAGCDRKCIRPSEAGQNFPHCTHMPRTHRGGQARSVCVWILGKQNATEISANLRLSVAIRGHIVIMDTRAVARRKHCFLIFRSGRAKNGTLLPKWAQKICMLGIVLQQRAEAHTNMCVCVIKLLKRRAKHTHTHSAMQTIAEDVCIFQCVCVRKLRANTRFARKLCALRGGRNGGG